MLLLNSTNFSYSLFEGIIYCMAAVFSEIDSQFPGFGILRLYQTCTALPADCSECSCPSILVTFENCIVFLFHFLQVQTLILFPWIGDKCFSIFDAVTNTLWVSHRINISKLPRMVYYNHRSLMILVNDAKYIHILPTFSTSSSPFILQ